MFTESATTERRIRHSKKFEELFSRLTTGEDAVFASKAQLLLLAAVIGYNEGNRTPFSDKDSFEPIRIATFENLGRIFHTVFNSIAIAETGDIKILSASRFEDVVKIFEEYACTGLNVIQSIVDVPQQKPFDSILDFIQKELTPEPVDSTSDVLQYF